MMKGKSSYIKCVSVGLLLIGTGLLSLADDFYVMPETLTRQAPEADHVMQCMETRVATNVWQHFVATHQAAFWLFGEDRFHAVRNNIIPAHWFPHAKTLNTFRGKAQPNEYYVFQVCVVSEHERTLTWRSHCPRVEAITPHSMRIAAHGVKPIWVGVDVHDTPVDGTITVTADGISQTLTFHIDVDGEPVSDHGIHDAWRLSRLRWLNSARADSETEVPHPFTALQVDTAMREIRFLGRSVVLSRLGLPEQYTSYFNASNTRITGKGRTFFSTAPQFSIDHESWIAQTFSFTKITPVRVEWTATAETASSRLKTTGVLEMDGYCSIQMALTGNKEIAEARLILPIDPTCAQYAMGLGKKGGFFPQHLDWKWDINKQQDAFWAGAPQVGLMFRLKSDNFERALVNAYYTWKKLNQPSTWGNGGVCLEGSTIIAYSGKQQLSEKPCIYGVDFYFTPFKPLDLHKHLTDRYYHVGQHKRITAEAIRATGANVAVYHHNTVQNPYINYPYNADSIGYLARTVHSNHLQNIRTKVYYTTREITQNFPEFFALYSLDGEVILPRNTAIPGWPCTNKDGPHTWLRQHVGSAILPAWRETIHFTEYPTGTLDLAVITTPDSRWNNFFLEGLNYLVQHVGIDGIYIDDTMLDRKSMQRARRILDADGHTDRRIDMHSWNHWSSLAGSTPSAVVFMELFPYYDKLWFGEGFNYDSPPEYYLTEISGIPYGVMSEMLQHGGNRWRGMVYGMTTRLPWSGDPRPLWAFFDATHLGDAEMSGYWDPETPVRSSNPLCPVTVYTGKDNHLVIAIANFSQQDQICQLQSSFSLNTLKIPAIADFQAAQELSPVQPFTVPAGKGFLMCTQPH